MRIVNADMILDGGTVIVKARKGVAVVRFQLDYSLPWDGRPRKISVTKFGRTRIIPIGSEEENDICNSIKECLEKRYGRDVVHQALESSQARKEAWEEWCARQEGPFVSSDDYEEPYPLPFDGIWFSVFDFVEKSYREGKL
jgi:hypothetical protein